MKYATVLPLAAAASAAIISSDLTGSKQVILHENNRHDSLWESLPGRQDVMSSIEEMVDAIGQSIDQAMDVVSRTGRRVVGSIIEDYEPRPHHGRGRRHGHSYNEANQSVYELIQDCRNARRFAKLIDEYDEIRERLQDDRREHTVFMPTDEAFEKLPRHERPSKEMMEKIIEYHIIPEAYTVGRIMSAHTIPTLLRENDLGHRDQRIRISVGLFGVHLNFYSQVIASNFMGTNGIVHAIDNVLIPPPRQGKLINALPGKFSTFSLAMEKTRLGEDLHERTQRGGTIFAPTNYAFQKLGAELNSYLFSDTGRKYLRALLRYHVVANETVYSDAYYESEEERRRHGRDHGDRRGHDGRRDRDDDRDGRHDRDHDDERRRSNSGSRDRNHNHDRDDRRHHRDGRQGRDGSLDQRIDTYLQDEGDYNRHRRNHNGDHEGHRHERDEERRRRRHGGRRDEDEDDDNDNESTLYNGDDNENEERRRDRDHRRRDRDERRRHRDDQDDENDDESDDEPEFHTSSMSRPRRHRNHHRNDDARDLDDLYSDSFFPENTWQRDLPTLLGDRTISVSIRRWMGLVSMRVNNNVRVSVQDGIARDGVVQVVESVLMPPRHGRHHREGDDDDYENGAMGVEELKERLERFVDDEEEGRHRGGRGGRHDL